MNLYNVINSSSVGKHLETINYKFSALEASFLIYYSKRITLKEKHALWNELIATMPDTPIEERPNTTPHDSLHEYLKQYMSLENSIIDRFYSIEKDTFYTYDFYCNGDRSWCDNNGLYKSIDECLEALKKDSHFDIKHIKLSKKYIDADGSYIDIYMNSSNEIISIDENRTLTENEGDIYYSVFEGLWFDFPLPFKKGEIIQYADCPYDVRFYFDTDDRSIVLEDDLIASEYLRNLHRKGGDISDMTVWGIFCNDDGKFYHECTSTYLDFEIQYKPLGKSEKAMLPLSNYLKGEISVDILCNAYHILLCEKHSNDIRRFMNITDDGMILAGLKTE